MTSDTVDYTRAIRSTPDKHAKTAPRPIIGFLTDLLAKILLPPLLLAELPYLIYIKLFKRTAPKWSFSRLVGTNVMRINGMFVSPWLPQPRSQQDQWNIPTDGEPYREAISRGEIDFEIVKLDPVDNKLRKGIADVPAVKGEATPGFWLRPKGSKSDKVILYIHGGAYVRGHPMWTPLAMNLAKETNIPVFAVNYRKCLSTSTAFPAPLLDALSAYSYLLKSNESSSITFVGDSAGAHLCLFLSRYLTTIDLPQPSAMGLISPWADFAPAYPSYRRNGWYDFLAPQRLVKAIDSAMRWYAPFMRKNVWFSPAKASKGDWSYLTEWNVDMHLTLGTRELFEDEIRLLSDVMERDGVEVRLYEHPDGVHTEMNIDAKARAAFIQGLNDSIAKN